MRDLYKRLGVPADASPETLDTAIEACRHTALRQDADAVLRIPARREAYDQLHATLGDLGRLRARLGLTHAPHWQDDVANDFSQDSDRSLSRHQELADKLDALVAGGKPTATSRRPWGWLVALLGAALLGLLAGAWL